MQSGISAAPPPGRMTDGFSDGIAPPEGSANVGMRVAVDGKFFRLGGGKWYVKGFTYGPFAPNSHGEQLPEPPQRARDFAQIRGLGGNVIRLYHPPSVDVLDEAAEAGLRVLVDVPWEKHRCFLEDYTSQVDAVQRVRKAARELGRHPGVFALSVANEVPHDVVRFYGRRRIERFIDGLCDAAKQEAPQCLVTYANYPTTEFLEPRQLDFYCANVYLEDPGKLGAYLDRLQHVAGPLPLVLGEFGLDTIRQGEARQALVLSDHVSEVFRRGLAGSFVFGFTDEWFSGGRPIKDWNFGVTRADRSCKTSAAALSKAWAQAPHVHAGPLRAAPSVSVVVCSYNGAATLEECLRSLVKLDYPDYEVILVDDGSTDNTREIAAKFPAVKCVRQENRGLSAARNRGAELARGQIVAYTDSDCVADELWLHYLVQAMQDQGVDAIGGPNVPPGSDNWTAKCVAASPGGPSHVMMDDRHAEHVPGCNMAFRRDVLLALGGFDEQFRQAGDDVDVCWRLLDAGKRIGYAPAALVWHHRRATVRAYLKQQKGYGKSEALLYFKHPQRFTANGCARWHGVIYGEGAVGMPVLPPPVYHGRFGSALFQVVYRQNRYSVWSHFTTLEWHVLALLVATFAAAWPPVLFASGFMWLLSGVAAAREAFRAPLPAGHPWWARGLVFVLHAVQPVVRGWHRLAWRLARRKLPAASGQWRIAREHAKRISIAEDDLYFNSVEALGREHLLEALETSAKREGWSGDFLAEWDAHDVRLFGDPWHDMALHTATEELGWPKRFTRVRCRLKWTGLAYGVCAVMALWLTASLAGGPRWMLWVTAALCIVTAGALLRSRVRCKRAVADLVLRAGQAAGLAPVARASYAAKAARRSDEPTPAAEVCME